MQQNVSESATPASTLDHWLVVPLYGPIDNDRVSLLRDRLDRLLLHGYRVVIVDNNTNPIPCWSGRYQWVCNGNLGGVAGGFNRGIAVALSQGAHVITLLDQDSVITDDTLAFLREPLLRYPDQKLLVGPMIWDERRQLLHQPAQKPWFEYLRTRLLISSGTTFSASSWSLLGPLNEDLFIDYVDHAWCFLAQSSGFTLLQHPRALLRQQFGDQHPQWLCRLLGMELYSPQRHFYSLRNVRWMMRQRWIPIDLRFKEVVKMCVKPWLWILFEPNRSANMKAIVSALFSPLPKSIAISS